MTRRRQMIAHDGLASFACDGRPTRMIASVTLVMDLLACYLVITEARVRAELTRCYLLGVTQRIPTVHCAAFS